MGSITGYQYGPQGSERRSHVYRVVITWTEEGDEARHSYATDIFGSAAKAREAATKFMKPRRERWRYGYQEQPTPEIVYATQLQRATLRWDVEQPAYWASVEAAEAAQAMAATL